MLICEVYDYCKSITKSTKILGIQVWLVDCFIRVFQSLLDKNLLFPFDFLYSIIQPGTYKEAKPNSL